MGVRLKMQKNLFPTYARVLTPRGQAIAEDTKRLIAAHAQAHAAVDTGEMRDKIHVTPTGVAADADHSGYVEYGTSKMAAQPFFVPAHRAYRQYYIDRLANELFNEP